MKEQIMNLDPNEKVLLEVKRHQVALYAIYISTGFGILVSLVLLYLVLKYQDDVGADLSNGLYIGAFGFIMIIVLLFGLIASWIHKRNEIVLTNENIVQILQTGLFNRQVSQLNLAKVQDVSVDQNGIFASMWNFGTLVIETAGEAANFRFIYTPEPGKVAKTIIEAHEDYIKLHSHSHDGV